VETVSEQIGAAWRGGFPGLLSAPSTNLAFTGYLLIIGDDYNIE
jgi:hypothetical protein